MSRQPYQRANLRSQFTHRLVRDCIVVVDLDEGMTVTNDAENVCRFLNERYGNSLDLYPIVYRDTEGSWDQLETNGGEFSNFRHLGAATEHEAIEKATA